MAPRMDRVSEGPLLVVGRAVMEARFENFRVDFDRNRLHRSTFSRPEHYRALGDEAFDLAEVSGRTDFLLVL